MNKTFLSLSSASLIAISSLFSLSAASAATTSNNTYENCPGPQMPAMAAMPKNHPHAFGDGTTPSAIGYTLNVVTLPQVSGKTEKFSFKIVQVSSKKPLQTFTSDMGKLLHLIIVSSDYNTYIHVHPSIDANGVFTAYVTLPHNGTYHYFTDFSFPLIKQMQPAQQVVLGGSFSLATSTNFQTSVKPLCSLTEQGYHLALSTTTVPFGHGMLMVNIDKNGTPVAFGTLLGVRAHMVIVSLQGQRYGHFHPLLADGSMSPMWGPVVDTTKSYAKTYADSGLDINPDSSHDDTPGMLDFMTEPPGPGLYMSYLQVVIDGKLHTFNFVLNCK